MKSLFAALLASVLCLTTQAMADPIRILPLGDSITQGGRTDREEYTYRLPLQRMLSEAGYDYDFIGSMNKGLNGDAKWPDVNGKPFDMDHEGHYGWKTAAVRDKLAGWLAKYPAAPDIVLIHLGTNDQGAAKAATTQAADDPKKTVTDEKLERELYGEAIVKPLSDMIGMLREKNPNVVVLVGHLNFNYVAGPRIRKYVEEMAKELSTEQSPVITVHHYKGWLENPGIPNTDTFDWAHPNPQGQEKMAKAWFEAMKPYLEKLKSK